MPSRAALAPSAVAVIGSRAEQTAQMRLLRIKSATVKVVDAPPTRLTVCGPLRSTWARGRSVSGSVFGASALLTAMAGDGYRRMMGGRPVSGESLRGVCPLRASLDLRSAVAQLVLCPQTFVGLVSAWRGVVCGFGRGYE